MASLIPSGSASGTGSMTLAAPVTNSNQTATLPDATGTVMVSGNMPAFSAYSGTAQSGITSGTFTKIAFNTETFDTNSNYDNVTNYRFTPTVAGYYQINAALNFSVTAPTAQIISIYKNGARTYDGVSLNGNYGTQITVSNIIFCNGTTDYIEIYGYIVGTAITFNTSSVGTYVSGAMVRAS